MRWAAMKLAARDALKRATLLPYGSNLRTPGAAFWIFSAWLAVSLMALAEGISWGYLGSFLGTGTTSFAAGMIAAVFIFTVIWIIDASFITLDTSQSFYEKSLGATVREETEWKKWLKVFSGVGSRVVIIIASLVITAPFLAQVVFRQDIDLAVESNFLKGIQTRREEIAKIVTGRIASVQLELDSLQGERVRESQGQGGSRRYGRGDAVETIEKVIAELQKEGSLLIAERDSIWNAFDQTPLDSMVGRWSVQPKMEGLQARGEILQNILANPSYVSAERAIRAFLMFLFLGIVILKVFSPRSVRVYYNEQLQDLYRQYLAGRFNGVLTQFERSFGSVGRMSPLRFEEWCLNTYSVMRTKDEMDRRRGLLSLKHGTKIEDLRQMLHDATEDLKPIKTQFEYECQLLTQLESESLSATQNRASALDDIAKFQKALTDIAKQISSGAIDVDSFAESVGIKANARNKLSEAKARHDAAEITIQRVSSSIAASVQSKSRLSDQIRATEELLETLSSMIQERRRTMADALSED